MKEYAITQKDREILRGLALLVAEQAAKPIEEKKKKLWTMHNDLKTHEPVVFIDPENGWKEIFPDSALQCESPIAREWEFDLRKKLYHADNLKDDFVIDDIFQVPLITENDGWGVELKRTGGGNGRAYHIDQVIEDYEEDFEKIHYPHHRVNREESAALLALAEETLGDILRVQRHHSWWWSLGMTWQYIDLRGLEDFMCDFILEPDWVHRMMNLLCEGELAMLDQLEKEGWLYSNKGNNYVGSGGFGFTEQLPEKDLCCTKDMWGFVESQETVSISPEMYGEFIFPYHKRIAERFGLNCFACCEPFDSRWKYARQLPNLRRVSCSPWSNRKLSPQLLEDKYISSYKLIPTPLASPHMDEDEVRRNLREVLDYSRDTVPELIMKDNNTLGGNPQNAVRWVELAREEIARS